MAELTYEEAAKLFAYDPVTGIITRKTKQGNYEAGSVVGTLTKRGYLITNCNYLQYMCHRLAWLLYHGAWPVGVVDHINGVKHDNRICNLRDISQHENLHNTVGRGIGSRAIRLNKQTGMYEIAFLVQNIKSLDDAEKLYSELIKVLP